MEACSAISFRVDARPHEHGRKVRIRQHCAHRLLQARFDLFVRKHELVVKRLTEEALAKPGGSYDFAVNDSAFFPSSTTVTGRDFRKRGKIIDGKIMLASKVFAKPLS